MKQFGESTMKKLSLDSAVPVESIFHFEGENYKEKQKVGSIGISMFLIL